MTIRYTCHGCESVLKIKDEKAGTNGRCPKCKTEFVVPFPADDIDGDAHGHSKPVMDALVDDVDMPIELTPEVADGPNSLILNQVTNGLLIRMACLTLLAQERRNNQEAS